MTGRIDLTANALAPLWALPWPPPRDLYGHPAYRDFKAFCERTFPAADKGLGFSFGLTDALRAVGVPCLTGGRATPGLSDAARSLVDAFDAKVVRRRYLCPLDGADRLPPIRFGAATVGQHSHDELLALFDATLLERCFGGEPLDPRLSQFQWLVVEEEVPAPPSTGQRAMPFLYENWSRDLGAIDPHAGSHPGPVASALFGLLLAPWEDWHSSEHDWRAFSIPWIHVATDDVFVRPRAVPGADTLSWEDAHHPGDDGEAVEYQRPLQVDLHDEAASYLRGFDQRWWDGIEAARSTDLFSTPVEHFLLRGALSDGMDQIMAHMTAIEAAIGMQSDFSNKGRPRSEKSTATRRMARRLARLLGDARVEADYATLFDMRSGFVHGRAMRGSIPSAERDTARRLARRAASALVAAANGPAGQGTREDFLTGVAP